MADDRIAILLLEDSPLDADLTLTRLARAGLAHEVTRVETRADFVAALERGGWDLILADYVLPEFDGLTALAVAQEVSPHTPFIFVSGALGEERAIESVLRGATDYVLKHRPERLVPAVQRALAEAVTRAEHRRAERALRDSEERARLALAAGRMCTWELEVATGSLLLSPECREVMGLPREQIGDTLEDFLRLVHPDDQGRLRGEIARTLSGNGGIEFRLRREDGTTVWLNLAARVVHHPEAPVRVVGVATDVTDRRRSEEHLRQVQRMEALGRLAGGMAHEANNQMAVVLGFADFVLRRREIPPDLRADVEQIRRAAERTAAITQQLLTFSRRQVVRPEVLELDAVVGAFEPVLRRTLGERCRLEFQLGANRSVRIGRGQLEQVLLNLVLNAGDAMPDGGTVTVRTAAAALPAEQEGRPAFPVRPGSYVLLAVGDTGVGMDQDTMDRIFEPFFTTKDIGKGTGLGLAAVYGIVKQSDGYVWARSQVGRGTTLLVYLPEVPSEAPVESDEELSGRGTETVLVVEDQEEVRTMASRTLAHEGYRVLEAADGQEALELLERCDGEVRLVLSDISMPVLDGRRLGDRLREWKPGLPLLFMSGYGEEDVTRRGLLLSGSAFIQKPFSPRDLTRRVRELLDAGSRTLSG
ncbi:MAG TPA: response regulator [Gemmatimonadales bacterium]|nr:response regulator [Gemmatimonadales bacterium]